MAKMDGANIERRRHIVDVAIRILDEGGVDALNMRHLAAELHLRPMAVYYYVPNKSTLLTMVLGEVVQRVVWSRYSGPPRERLLSQSVDLYDKLSDIPWISDVLHEGTSVGIPSLSQAEDFLSACYDLGFDDDEAFGLWRTTWFVISSELQWNGEARVRRGDHMLTPEFTDADLDAHPSAARVFGQWSSLSEGYSVVPYLAALIDGAIANARTTVPATTRKAIRAQAGRKVSGSAEVASA